MTKSEIQAIGIEPGIPNLNVIWLERISVGKSPLVSVELKAHDPKVA